MRISFRQRHNGSQTGAVLLAVLIVALVLIILLGVVSQALNNRINLAQQAKQNLQDAALVYGKLNEISYLLATQRITVAGISTGVNPQGILRDDGHWLLNVIGDEIRTDGFIYSDQNQLLYSIQNEAGLIGINSSGQFWLKTSLSNYGLSLNEQNRYADTLADYADSDDWRRPAGAESFAYEKIKHPLPRNYLLQSCNELWRLETWLDWLKLHSDWLHFCSLRRSESLNLNSVPIELWRKLWPNSTIKISNMRLNGKWFLVSGDVTAVEPKLAQIQDEYFTVLGGSFFILKITKGGVTIASRLEVGDGKNKPFVLK